MIRSLRCGDAQALFQIGKSRRFSAILAVATRKLALLDAAQTLEFLRTPPAIDSSNFAAIAKGNAVS